MNKIILQGFSWESYKDSRYPRTLWRDLQKEVEDISTFFDAIWLPPHYYSKDAMGYWPYQLSNYESTWGTKQELTNLIRSFRDNNVDVYADVNLNHHAKARSFMKEKFIHEFRLTDDDFYGAIGSPNNNIRIPKYRVPYTKNVKGLLNEYLNDLEKIGFNGFRIDSGKQMDCKAARELLDKHPNVSVIHENFDTNYWLLKNYIEQFNSKDCLFNFNMKFRCINEGIAQCDLSKLVYNDNIGGMLDSGLRWKLVNFVENHDSQDNHMSFINMSSGMDRDKIIIANAYILMSYGSPCIFLPHWKMLGIEIGQLIDIRRSYGIGEDCQFFLGEHSKSRYSHMIKHGDDYIKLYISFDNTPIQIESNEEVLFNDKYVLIVGNKKVVWSTHKEYIEERREKHNIHLTFTNKDKWRNVYYWDDSLEWPGRKLEKNHYGVDVRDVEWVDFIFNNGDSEYPKQTANIRAYDDMII